MDVATLVYAFVFGTVIGSFLNVVVLRLGKESLRGRSHCPHCHRTLRVWELVPVISYIILRGRCATCHAPLSIQYPLVELSTGAMFAALTLYLPYNGVVWWGTFIYGATLLALAMAIFVYDIRHTIIPDVLIYPALLLAFLGLFVGIDGVLRVPSLFALAAGPLLALPIAALWYFSKGRWIGLGDAKIALAIGWLLGITAGATALAIGFWSGAIVGVALLGISHLWCSTARITMKSEVPFAPFLLFGAAATYATGINFFLVI